MSNFTALTAVAWLYIFSMHAAMAGDSKTNAGMGGVCAGDNSESRSHTTGTYLAEVISGSKIDLRDECRKALFQDLYWYCLIAEGPDATASNCADWMKMAVEVVDVPLVERAGYLWNFMLAAASKYTKEGRHAKAEEALNTLEKAVRLGNPDTMERRLALVFQKKGDLYLSQSRLEDAAHSLSSALENATSIDDKFAMRASLVSMGKIYERQERYAEASDVLSRAEEVTVEDCGRDCPLLLDILDLHASVKKKLGKISDAESLRRRHEELDALLKEIDLAKTYYEEGDFETASILAERAQARHKKIGGDVETLIMILEGRAELAKQLGDEKRAKELRAELKHLQQASDLKR